MIGHWIDLFLADPWSVLKWNSIGFGIGYLLGSIPFGLIFTRMAGLGDLRQIGSGNIGATNALRTGNKAVALATLICDGGKGAVAIFVAMWVAQAHPELRDIIAMKAAAGAFLGHLFPIWLKFRGGKGVATFIGIHLALVWPVGLLVCVTWLAVTALFRYSSLAALIATLLTPVYLIVFGQIQVLPLSIFLVLLIYVTHRDNIKRLLARTEPRIGAKK